MTPSVAAPSDAYPSDATGVERHTLTLSFTSRCYSAQKAKVLKKFVCELVIVCYA